MKTRFEPTGRDGAMLRHRFGAGFAFPVPMLWKGPAKVIVGRVGASQIAEMMGPG